MSHFTATVPQGFSSKQTERLPLPPREALNDAQRKAADLLLAGPRRGVKGPFVALLRSPQLMERLAAVGEYLRFDSALPARINEFVTLIVARELSNQFEWTVHHPLALAAGTARTTLLDLARGMRPRDMSDDETAAYEFTTELWRRHGVSDPTYARAHTLWGEQGVVELTALIGYFACVSWMMNVARTSAPAAPDDGALEAFPP